MTNYHGNDPGDENHPKPPKFQKDRSYARYFDEVDVWIATLSETERQSINREAIFESARPVFGNHEPEVYRRDETAHFNEVKRVRLSGESNLIKTKKWK